MTGSQDTAAKPPASNGGDAKAGSQKEPPQGAAAAAKPAKAAKASLGTVVCFVLFLVYVQATCLLCFLLLLLGVSVSHAALAANYVAVLQTRFAQTADSKPVQDDRKEPVIYLSNHRSWGDFWVDAAILGGPSFVSRLAVAVVIPCSALWGSLQGWIFFFQRGAKHAEGATAWMANFLRTHHAACPGKGVVLYPEGTRTLLPEGLPLRPGGLAAAYKLGWPVQIVITTNKERVMAERSLSVGCKVRCVTAVSAPLRPGDFATSDEFIEAVRTTWRATWQQAYSSEGVDRPGALLPGAARRPHRLDLLGRPGSNAARLLAVVVAAAAWYLR